MKVSRNIEEEINIVQIIEKLQEEHDTIYWETIDNIVYVYKPIGRRDFEEVTRMDADDNVKEDEIIRKTLLYPVPDNDFFVKIKAGIFIRLLNVILESSHVREDDILLRVQITNAYRAEMFDLQNQVTCIIHEAFPEYDLEDIENWGIEKTAKFLSRAEWILVNMRNMEINSEVSEAAMAGNYEKYLALVKEQEEAEKAKSNISTGGNSDIDVPKTKKLDLTPEKLAELKRKIPEINWEADSALAGESGFEENFEEV